MKKIFYLVALCTLIALLGAYIKANSDANNMDSSSATIVKTSEIVNTEQVAESSEASEVTEETSSDANKDCECKSECICPEGETDCDCEQTKSVCSCKDANGDVVTVESIETNNSDIEEINPEETSEEGETVVSE